MEDRFVTQNEMREAIAAAKAEIAAEMGDTFGGLVREAQADLLEAISACQETTGIRIRTVEASVSIVDSGISERLNNVERLLWKIQSKLLLHRRAA